MKKIWKTVGLMVMVVMIGAGLAQAKYPERPITMIVGYGAGGVTDIMARALSNLMAKEMKGNIIVKNVVGAAGTIGAAELSDSKADGYTLGYLPVGAMASQPNLRTLPYKWNAFTSIVLVSDNPIAVVAAKNSPWKDFPDAVKDMKANPGKYFFGSSGPGGSPHVALQALFTVCGVDIGHMPAKDSASAILALQSGTVHFYADPPVIIKHFDLKGMGIFGEKRMETFPDIPTFKEMGFNVPPLSGWHGLFGPPDMESGLLSEIEAIAKKVILSPEFADICKRTDMQVSFMDSKTFKPFFEEQYHLYGKLMEEFGLKKK